MPVQCLDRNHVWSPNETLCRYLWGRKYQTGVPRYRTFARLSEMIYPLCGMRAYMLWVSPWYIETMSSWQKVDLEGAQELVVWLHCNHGARSCGDAQTIWAAQALFVIGVCVCWHGRQCEDRTSLLCLEWALLTRLPPILCQPSYRQIDAAKWARIYSSEYYSGSPTTDCFTFPYV